MPELLRPLPKPFCRLRLSHEREFGGAAARPIRRLLDLAQSDSPRSCQAAETALAEALRGVTESAWSDVAWRFSRLNGDGFPVEFTFSSAEDGVRYTSEIAGPEWPEHLRWEPALLWAGARQVDSLAVRVARWQQGTLRWGAWVGGFHSEFESRRKVYLETGSASCLPEELPAIPGARLRFIGLNSFGAETEFYFRRDMLEKAELGRLLCRLGWRECFEPLCNAISSLLPRPHDDQLVPTNSGFSIAPGRALSLFTYARSLWGGDGSIRSHLLDSAHKYRWDFRVYEAVTRPLENVTGPCTSHGILGWVAAPGKPVEVRISVRPPN